MVGCEAGGSGLSVCEMPCDSVLLQRRRVETLDELSVPKGTSRPLASKSRDRKVFSAKNTTAKCNTRRVVLVVERAAWLVNKEDKGTGEFKASWKNVNILGRYPSWRGSLFFACAGSGREAGQLTGGVAVNNSRRPAIQGCEFHMFQSGAHSPDWTDEVPHQCGLAGLVLLTRLSCSNTYKAGAMTFLHSHA